MEFRQNIATREWVLFCPERGQRPEEFRQHHGDTVCTHTRPTWRADCPFCPGGEHDHTPGETSRRLDADGHWTVRSFPNRFPAVLPQGDAERFGDPFHHSMEAVGLHEVIAESALHNVTLALQSEADVRQVLSVWRERLRAMRERSETEHVVVFKNHGPTAGTSLEHPHSQIVSLPVTPWQVRHRLEEAMGFYDDTGHCVFCRMIEVEDRDGERVVAQGKHFIGFIPYASYSPFSLWIMPFRHHCCFSHTADDEMDDLAVVIRSLLARLYHGLQDPAYNLVLRIANRDQMDVHYFHWYIAIVPRLQRAAGFEMGTGMFINLSLPEYDAAFLRRVDLPAPDTRQAEGSVPVNGEVHRRTPL